MKTLFVNTNDTSGGAARAAMRIMQGVRQLDVDAQMFVKCKYSNAEDVVSLNQFLPKNKLYRIADWVAQKLKNKYHHLLWRPYSKTKENVFMSDSWGTRLGGALQNLDYDILHLHWINQRFIKLQDLPKNKPIVWTLHDSWAIRYAFQHFYHHAVAILPCIPYVDNIGFDGTGIHSGNDEHDYRNNVATAPENPKMPYILYKDERIINAFANCYSRAKRPLWQKVINAICRMSGKSIPFEIKKKIYA